MIGNILKMKYVILFLLILFSKCVVSQVQTSDVRSPKPNAIQMKYLHSPLAGFIHYGINTYTGDDGIEWGDKSKEPSTSFNPTADKIDTDQWVRLFKKAGFSRIIVVLKHHDGFCLWQTKQTDYNISNSPYINGKGDLAKEFSESCDKYEMDMGIYLSPWDAHEVSYGDTTPGDYNDFYVNQLVELLSGDYGRMNPETGKREIVEVWLDGASGSLNKQTYDLNRFYKTVRELQPNTCIWMDNKWHFNQNGERTDYVLDAIWVGNEDGYINDPAWCLIDLDKINNGEQGRSETGNLFCVSEADVSIRPGWFYHSQQDKSVKDVSYLIDSIYMRTVGMGIPLLLNVPPNREGKIHPIDSATLINFGKEIKKLHKDNLISENATIESSSCASVDFPAFNAIDGDYNTYWRCADNDTNRFLIIDFGEPKEFNIVKIQEYIELGQHVAGFKVEFHDGDNWIEFGKGKTIGYQRLVRGENTKSRKIKITFTETLAAPNINNVEVFFYY